MHVPALTNTAPVERIGQFPQWRDPKKIVLLIPIKGCSPLGVAGIKRMVNIGADLDFEGAVALNEALRWPLEGTEDYEEGIRAFFEKRKPVFRGT